MPIDFSRTTQALEVESKIKSAMYGKINETAKKTGAIRLAAPGVAITSALLTVTFGVASIGENIFKGLVNICGACCAKDMTVRLGFKQLLFGTYLAISDLTLRVVKAAFAILVVTGQMLINLEKFTESRVSVHDERRQRFEDKVPPKHLKHIEFLSEAYAGIR
jgi:hypothetical protein